MASIPAHIVSGVADVQTINGKKAIVTSIASMPPSANITSFEFTGTKSVTSGDTTTTTYKNPTADVSVYLFNEEQAMIDFAESSAALNTTLTSAQYAPLHQTPLVRSIENPAFYLIFTDTIGTIPTYPKNVKVKVNETWDQPCPYNIYGRRQPQYAGSMQYRLFLLIVFDTAEDITSIQYRMTIE